MLEKLNSDSKYRCHKRAYGLFEFSLLFSITASMIFGAWGLTSMVQANSSLQTELEHLLSENSVNAWSMDQNFELKLNKDNVEAFMISKVEELYKGVANLHFLTPGKSVFVEVALGELEVNVNTGKSIGSVVLERMKSKGESSLSKGLDHSDFSHIFSQFNKSDSGKTSLWATPHYNDSNGNTKYLPKAFFVGVRAYVEANGMAKIFKNFTLNKPVYYSTQVTTLRGELSL